MMCVVAGALIGTLTIAGQDRGAPARPQGLCDIYATAKAPTEALGAATVHFEQGDAKVVGRGASTDIIEASAKAYVDGLNKLARLPTATTFARDSR